MTTESKRMLLGLIAVIAFGLTLPATRYVIPYFDPIFIGLGRAVTAAFFAILLLIITKQAIPSKIQFYKLTIIALGVVVGFPVLSAWAMQTVPASHGGVVLGILPLATAFVSVLISNERPSKGFWLSGLLGGAIVISYSLIYGVGGLHIGGIARVSQTQLIQPFVTIIASALLVNESLDAVTIIFALLVVSTVAVGKKMPIYKKPSTNTKRATQ